MFFMINTNTIRMEKKAEKIIIEKSTKEIEAARSSRTADDGEKMAKIQRRTDLLLLPSFVAILLVEHEKEIRHGSHSFCDAR